MMSPMEERVCRECFEDTGEVLIAPCACVGSLRWVHPSCLPQEVTHGDGFICSAEMVCEVCKEPMDLDREEPAKPEAPPDRNRQSRGVRACGLALALCFLLAQAFRSSGPARLGNDARSQPIGSVLATVALLLLAALGVVAALVATAQHRRRMPVSAAKVRGAGARGFGDVVLAMRQHVWSARLLSRPTTPSASPTATPAPSLPGSPRPREP